MSNSEKMKMHVQRSVRELGILRDIFIKSDTSLAKYKTVMEAFGKLFMSMEEPNGDDYKHMAGSLSDAASRFNDEGDNLMMKEKARSFASRIKDYSAGEVSEYLKAINDKDNKKFLFLLESHGYFVDPIKERKRRLEAEERRKREEAERKRREEEERKRREEEERKKREDEERRRREEEERRRREAEERRKREEEERKRKEAEANKPKTYYVNYCTNCGAKFQSNEYKYCTNCGMKRQVYTA